MGEGGNVKCVGRALGGGVGWGSGVNWLSGESASGNISTTRYWWRIINYVNYHIDVWWMLKKLYIHTPPPHITITIFFFSLSLSQ